MYSRNQVSLFARATWDSVLSGLHLAANLKIATEDWKYFEQHTYGLTQVTEGDEYTDIDLQIVFDNTQHVWSSGNYFYFLFGRMGGTDSPTKVDRIKITGGIDVYGSPTSYLIKEWSEPVTPSAPNTISNMYVDIHIGDGAGKRLFETYKPTSILISNIYVNYNFNFGSQANPILESDGHIFANALFTGYGSFHYTREDGSTVYTGDDDPAPTADLLNANLHDGANKGIPAGKYLPWKTDDQGRVVLDMDALPSELIEVE